MLKSVWLGFILALCMSVSPALAYSNTSSQCVGNYSRILNGTDAVNDTRCSFGCNVVTGLCADPYGSDSTWIYFLFPLIAIFLLYLSNSLKEDDWAVHLMLLLVAIVFVISSMALLQIRTDALGMSGLSPIITTLYWLLLVILIIVLLYYFIKTLSLLVTRIK